VVAGVRMTITTVVRPDNYRIYAYLPAETDITADVIGNITSYWGEPGNTVLDRLAETGATSFTLKNPTYQYSPNSTTVLPGWKKGVTIKLVITYDGANYVRGYGTIDQIDVDGGLVANQSIAKVTILDWIDYSAKYPLVSPAIQTNKTADQALTTIVNAMPIAPQDTDFNTGVNTFPALFDTVTTKTKAYTEFSKLVLSELGHIYLRRDKTHGETLVFESNYARNGLVALTHVPIVSTDSGELLKEDGGALLKEDGGFLLLDEVEDATIDNVMLSLDIVYGKNIVNRMTATAYPKKVDTTLSVLYSLSSPMEIGSNQTITFRGNYSDPTGGAIVTAISDTMVQPVINTDYKMWTASNGTGTDITTYLTVSVVYGTEAPIYTLTNTSIYTGYITLLQARGYGIKAYNPIETSQESAGSYNEYGYQEQRIDQKYQRDLTFGELETKKVLDQEKQPRTVLNSITMNANSSASLMIAFLNVDIGDLVHIKETRLEINGYYYIQGISFTIQPGGIIFFTWIVKQALSLASGLSLITAEFNAVLVSAESTITDTYISSLLHMNGVDGSTTFTDTTGKVWTARNHAQIDTAQFKFGGASGLFDGTDDYIDTPDSADHEPGAGDFTVDFWIRFNSIATSQALFCRRTGADGDVFYGMYMAGGTIQFAATLNSVTKANYTSLWTPTLNTWYHVEYVRSGSSFYIFIDGVSKTLTVTVAIGTKDLTFTHAGELLVIGRLGDYSDNYFNGWMDEFCFRKGIARHTSNFTPPTAEYSALIIIPAVYTGDAVNYGVLPQVTNLTQRTYSAWIYVFTDAYDNDRVIIGNYNDYMGAFLQVTGGGNALVYRNNNFTASMGLWWHDWTTYGWFTKDVWHHVAVTHDQSSTLNDPIIYVDGTSWGSKEVLTPSGTNKDDTGANFAIGNIKSPSVDYSWPFNGRIKDARVYNRILTPTEVATLNSEGAGGTGVTTGMVFQSPCVRTSDLAHYTDLTLTDEDKLIDNIYGVIGTKYGSPITRLI
jgi:hypothetical protein